VEGGPVGDRLAVRPKPGSGGHGQCVARLQNNGGEATDK
jgi:hypothetical protein